MNNKIKERPILFNGDMVRAILTGTKTQTRRIVKPRNGGAIIGSGGHGIAIESHGVIDDCMDVKTVPCPYGNLGDQLWVRETWGVVSHEFDENGVITDWKPNRPAAPIHEMPFGRGYYSGHVIYAADGSFEWIDDYGDEKKCWKPSIHMPRKASRIQLEITGIRVERLNDCSEDDAKAEGVIVRDIIYADEPKTDYSYIDQYKVLWESINGAGSWAVNPWVWVVEFKVVKP